MKLINQRNFMVKISGNHYFACDYVFSNIYGESVFFDEADEPPADAFDGAYPDDGIAEEALLDTLPETPFDTLSTLPDCTKQIEYATEGSVVVSPDNSLNIRYGSDDAPMCIHICSDGSVTLSGDDDDIAEIVFEKGKRNFIALPETAFMPPEPDKAPPSAEDPVHAPIHLCVSTAEIQNNMTPSGGSLSVSYTIEVNGMLAEVTDFTVTANHLNG